MFDSVSILHVAKIVLDSNQTCLKHSLLLLRALQLFFPTPIEECIPEMLHRINISTMNSDVYVTEIINPLSILYH